jgi:VIT1/CCC1 family predicted Fe2+/Mn2+ transporter
MELLIFVAVVLVVLALVLYAISLLPAIQPPIKNLLMVVCVLIAALVIVQRSGLLR